MTRPLDITALRKALPAAMRDAGRWLLWRSIPAGPGKKPRKVPHYANGRARTATDTPADTKQLATLEQAVAAYGSGGWSGLGFALGPDALGRCWQGIDLDDLPARPELQPAAAALPGYVESSPSGKGVHAIGYGPTKFATLGANGSGVEAYSSGRFFTVTGDVLRPGPLVDLSDTVTKLAPLHAAGASARTPPAAPAAPAQRLDPDAVAWANDVSDETLAELRDALKWVDADSRETWIKVGHALKAIGDRARELWHEYSAQCPEKYDQADAERVWEGLKPASTGYASVFAHAQRNGWINPKSLQGAGATPSQANGAPPDTQDLAGRLAKFKVYSAEEFVTTGEPPSWLIKGVLPRAGLCMVVGSSRAGKTFVVLDMAAAIARGVDWHGCRTKRARVVIVAAEAAGSVRRRIEAYSRDRGLELSELDIGVIGAAPSLLDGLDVSAVCQNIAARGGADLVVLDTFAATTIGADEKDGQDMGPALAACARIHEATGATILIVHHLGKDEAKGARGWSGLLAAADCEITIKRDGDSRVATVTKQKDGPDGQEYHFTLRTVTLGVDEDLDPITSCVVDYASGVPTVARPGRGAVEQVVLDTATELGCYTSAQLIAAAKARLPRGEGRDRRGDLARQAVKTLSNRGALPVEHGGLH